jgi:hypothetical protein
MVVAEQPSESWVCDRTASVVVSADFKEDKFVGTHIWVWPHGCL